MSWRNGGTDVFLPNANNDVILVFIHFLNHFFIGSVGLRQICDWWRLLGKYRDEINRKLLEDRLCKSETGVGWKAFAAFVVGYLGMPEDTIPMYDSWLKSKADKIMRVVMEVGNFG